MWKGEDMMEEHSGVQGILEQVHQGQWSTAAEGTCLSSTQG